MARATSAVRDALKARDELREQRRRALEIREQHRERVERIDRELKPLPRERERALRKAARAGKADAPEVAELDAKREQLRAEREQHVAAAKAATAASKSAARDLTRLHADRFSEFAEAAQSLTEAAEAKLERLAKPYREAFEAIEQARREWSLIVADRESVRLDRADPAQRVGPEFRAGAISAPPPNPLPPPGAVFPGAAIRPVEVERIEEAIADAAA